MGTAVIQGEVWPPGLGGGSGCDEKWMDMGMLQEVI